MGRQTGDSPILAFILTLVIGLGAALGAGGLLQAQENLDQASGVRPPRLSALQRIRAEKDPTATASSDLPACENGSSIKCYRGSVGSWLPLNVLWRVLVDGADRMITVDPAERDAFPLEGAIFYVPMNNEPASGLLTLYRLFNGFDHMVSTDPNAGKPKGYSPEGPLGYPFSSTQAGTSQLIQTFNPATGDHSLRNSTGLETEKGYTDEPMGIYGYPRYYNQNTHFLTLTGGGVTIQSNLVAGGVLWHWIWNGLQLVNNYDYGRQIQTDIFPPDFANPTEAGDTWTHHPQSPGLNHGSPAAFFRNQGLTQSTRSLPLDFDPDGTQQCPYVPPLGPCPGFGGGPNNPVLWKDVVLGKDITLDFNHMGPVALYTTVMKVPKALSAATAREIPVVYLRTSLYRMFTYDAETGSLSEQACNPNGASFIPSYGGVIAATADESAAMGEYAVNKSQGGSVDGLFLLPVWTCPGPPADTGEFDFDTTILDGISSGPFAAGTTRTNVYLISGNLDDVVRKMAELYRDRDLIPR